jgi:hypothetical protein
MMQAITESVMKGALDGRFTRLMPDGSVKVVRVAAEFIPTYGVLARVEPRGPRRPGPPFTADEDATVITMTRAGAKRGAIARAIRRKLQSIWYRQNWLRARGRL